MGLRKKSSKETIIRQLFGNYELRISDVKCEIEDVKTFVEIKGKKVQLSKKWSYPVYGYEFGLFSFLLSPVKMIEGKPINKTADEIEQQLKEVEMMILFLAHENLFFSNADFKVKYWELIKEQYSKPLEEISKEADDKIIDELKLVEEMTSIAK